MHPSWQSPLGPLAVKLNDPAAFIRWVPLSKSALYNLQQWRVKPSRPCCQP